MRAITGRAHSAAILIGILMGLFASGQNIPAISGVVLDAITGKPVAGVDVILRASQVGGGRAPRNQNSTTRANGGFDFPGSERSNQDFLSIPELSITVNHAFISPDQDAGNDVSMLISIHVAHDDEHSLPKPAAQRAFERFNNPLYFPMAVQFLSDCHAVWNAACVSLSPYESLHLLLIPMLDNPAQCKAIKDAETREKCRQLNTYRAAFMHRETIEQVRRDKKLCEDVDHGRISAECLERLHMVVRHSAKPQGSISLPQKMEPIGRALILAPAAGLEMTSPRVISFDPFEEITIYTARYGLINDPFGSGLFSVVVDNASTIRSSKDLAARTGGVPPGTQKLDVIDGNRVTTVEHDASSRVVWKSGTRVVTLEFDHYTTPGSDRQIRAVNAASAAWPALIRAYLKKFPSSS